ncbi:hypothetical protein C7N43_34550 [Sphingobacteriales bacterium UPWRP_1]|nr:hypothetical protein C7N43_34550 [Sphingobacteriales bacterium UPWRP_1]
MKEKKIFSLSKNCRLYPPEPSAALLNKQWLVYYYVEKKRIQKKGVINRYKTVDERIAEAKRVAFAIEADIKQMRQNEIEQTPFLIALKRAYESRCRFLKPKSAATYKTKIMVLQKYLSQNLINNPTKEDISRFFEQLPIKHPNTLSVYRVTLFSLAKDMVKNGDLYENIFEHIQVKKIEGTPKYFFSQHQISRLKNEMEHKGLHLLWLACKMQHYTFLRPREMRALKVSDLFLEENKILIRAEIAKNKKREYVVVPQHLCLDLQKHITAKQETDWVFSINGKQIAENRFYNDFRAVLDALNMDTQKHSFYSWKHTGARAWIKAGGSVYGLMRQMRHHSLDQTQQYLRKLGILEFEDDVNAMPVI